MAKSDLTTIIRHLKEGERHVREAERTAEKVGDKDGAGSLKKLGDSIHTEREKFDHPM